MNSNSTNVWIPLWLYEKEIYQHNEISFRDADSPVYKIETLERIKKCFVLVIILLGQNTKMIQMH